MKHDMLIVASLFIVTGITIYAALHGMLDVSDAILRTPLI